MSGSSSPVEDVPYQKSGIVELSSSEDEPSDAGGDTQVLTPEAEASSGDDDDVISLEGVEPAAAAASTATAQPQVEVEAEGDVDPAVDSGLASAMVEGGEEEEEEEDAVPGLESADHLANLLLSESDADPDAEEDEVMVQADFLAHIVDNPEMAESRCSTDSAEDSDAAADARRKQNPYAKQKIDPEAIEIGTGTKLASTIPSPRQLDEEIHREQRQQRYRRREKRLERQLMKRRQKLGPRGMMVLMKEREMYMRGLDTKDLDEEELEELQRYMLDDVEMETRQFSSSEGDSSDDMYYEAQDGEDGEEGEEYDGDDEDAGNGDDRSAEKLSGQMSKEIESLRSADEARKQDHKKKKEIGEDSECHQLNTLQLEALFCVWPLLLKKVQPLKVMPLLFLTGALSLQEVNETQRFCETTKSRKAGMRFFLGLLRHKSYHLDTLFRVVIDNYPDLEVPILSSLRKQCASVTPHELAAVAMTCGVRPRPNVNRVPTNGKDPKEAEVEEEAEEKEQAAPNTDGQQSEWKTLVRPNLPYLNSRLNGVEIAQRCAKNDLLTEEQLEQLLPKLVGMNQVDVLFRCLRSTGSEGYKVFVDILRGFGDKYRDVHHHLFRYQKKLKEEEKKKMEDKPKQSQSEAKEDHEISRELCPELCEPFLGRDDFVDDVMGTLENMEGDPSLRILALKGSFGSGKSSVVTAVARRLLMAGESLHYVPVRGLGTASLVARRIVHTISPHSSEDGIRALGKEMSRQGVGSLLVLDNLEDCVYSPQRFTQLHASDVSLASVLNDIIEEGPGVRILLTTRRELPKMNTEVIYKDIPALDFDSCAKHTRMRCPHLTREERHAVAEHSLGIPYALELLCVLAKYSRKSIEDVIEEASDRFNDMNVARWSPADHLVYILVEMVGEAMPKKLERAMFSLCTFYGPVTQEAICDVMQYINPQLIERHVLRILQRMRLLGFDTMLERYVTQPVVIKHGFASLEDHEHRECRRAFVTHYLAKMLHYMQTTPDDMTYLGFMQDQFRLDYSHLLRAFRHCNDLQDDEVLMMMSITQNPLFLAFPTDMVFRFLQRACHLCPVETDAFNVCATHLMLTYYHELTDNCSEALVSLAAIFHGAVTHLRQPDVLKEDVVPYRELLFFCRVLERRFKLRVGMFTVPQAQEAAQLAFGEFHSLETQMNPLTYLCDLYTLACAGRWQEVPRACKRLFDSVRYNVANIKTREPVKESLKHAICRYANDGMIVFIAYATLALRDPSLLPEYSDLLHLMTVLMHIGRQLALVDQRDAVNELTKKWHTMRYDKVATTSGVPFELLMLAILRARTFSSFPADPIVVSPATGLSDWLLCMDESQAMRLYMESNKYSAEADADAAADYAVRLQALSMHEKKILVLLNKAFRHEHDLLTPLLVGWEAEFGDCEAWMIVEIEGVPFMGSEITSYILLLAFKACLDKTEQPLSDEDLVHLMRFARVANCCGQCLKYKSRDQKMNHCQRCTIVLYCDRGCQKKHYQKHKRLCARLNQIKQCAHIR